MHTPFPPFLAGLFRAEHVAESTRALLEPLVGHVASQERTIRHQAETIGTLRAELVATRAQIAVLNTPAPKPAPEPEPPQRPLPGPYDGPSWCCRRWRSWIAAGIMLAVIGPTPYPASPNARRRSAPPAPR